MFQKIPRDSFLRVLLSGRAPQAALLLPPSSPVFYGPLLTSPCSLLRCIPSSFSSFPPSLFLFLSYPVLHLCFQGLLPPLLRPLYHSQVERKSFLSLSACLSLPGLPPVPLTEETQSCRTDNSKIGEAVAYWGTGLCWQVYKLVQSLWRFLDSSYSSSPRARTPKEQKQFISSEVPGSCGASSRAPSHYQGQDSSVASGCSGTHTYKNE